RFIAGTAPAFLAIGDFNGDSLLDLAVANAGDGINPSTVSILLGNGDGTFQGHQDYAVGANPGSIAVGDFNQDGYLDLAVANMNNDRNSRQAGTVSVLLGNGNGTFASALNFTAGSFPGSVLAADINLDGGLDLAVINQDPGLSILLSPTW